MYLLQELRRRKVFRLAALYIIGAWVVLQVADLALKAGVLLLRRFVTFGWVPPSLPNRTSLWLAL